MKKDIQNRDDIILLVDSFYEKVRENELLSPIFNEKIKDNWDKHLAKMYNFWETILLDNHSYSGAPFAAHMNLPIYEEHFKNWLMLFFETIDELFEGTKAEEAKWRAVNMGKVFLSKLDYIRNNPNTTPIQ